MELQVTRLYKKDSYTIGCLYIDGIKFCDTLEDKDRGLSKDMPLSEILNKKVYGETAIPTGTYEVSLDIISPKFSQYPFYQEVCDGRLPRILGVPGFEGILFHVADGSRGAKLLHGCIGVGRNKIKGGLLEGKDTFRNLYKKMGEAKQMGETITLIIE